MLTAQNITETSDSDGIRDSEGGGEPVRLVARPTFPANASGNANMAEKMVARAIFGPHRIQLQV